MGVTPDPAGTAQPPDEPVIDMGYLSLPAGTQQEAAQPGAAERLAEIDRLIDDADGQGWISAGDAPYNPHALAAIRAAEMARAEVVRLRDAEPSPAARLAARTIASLTDEINLLREQRREAVRRAEQVAAELCTLDEAAREAIAAEQQRTERYLRAMDEIAAERNAAEAALERVRAEHPRDQAETISGEGGYFCGSCSRLRQDYVNWPCPTVAALSAPADDGGEG